MEVLCVSLLVQQIFKIMFRGAASHEGLMMLYRMCGLCRSNEMGAVWKNESYYVINASQNCLE